MWQIALMHLIHISCNPVLHTEILGPQRLHGGKIDHPIETVQPNGYLAVNCVQVLAVQLSVIF